MDVRLTDNSAPAQPGALSRRSALIGAAALASALAVHGRAYAQDATPTPGGITVQGLGAGLPAATPGRQLILARMTFPPGSALPPHTHPGPVVAYVESGTFGFTPVSGEASQVTRSANPSTPEVPTVGAESVLEAGDALFHDEDVVGIDRAVGDAPCVLLLAVSFDVGAPLYHLMGTPTP